MLRFFSLTALLAVSVLTFLPNGARAELIVNGDFTAGNTGFTTQYLFSPGDIGPAQSYDVVSDPALSRPRDINPVSYRDHKTGTGLMMAINESRNPNVLIWGQTVALAANTDYTFSLWLSSWFPQGPSQIDIRFNGVSIGTPTAPSAVAIWQEFRTTWNSGSATSATIEIRNLTTFDIGGDFALDDISLNPTGVAIPEPGSLMLLGVGAMGLLSYRWRHKRWMKAGEGTA